MTGIELIIPAFIAGLLMFLAPCTLPLVPAYLGFISGVSNDDLNDADEEKAHEARKKIFSNGLFFILGFSVIFIVFGTLAGLIGQNLGVYRDVLGRVGGAFIIFFGLFMLGVFKLPFLNVDKRIQMPSFLTVGKPSSSFIIGSAFAFGWTPCVGPILASILLLASTSSTALQGGFLLGVFSLGLAIPFLAVALLISRSSNFITKYSKYLNYVSIVGGIFLILLGLLLLFGQFGLTIQYGYQFFDFLHYDALLDYL